MDQQTRENLEAKGWRVGSASDFLGLTPEESTIVEIKLALGRILGKIPGFRLNLWHCWFKQL